MANINGRFAERVAFLLEQLGRSYQVEPTIGGFTPDFVVALGNGQSAVIEAKGWEPTRPNLERAADEARFLKERLGPMDVLVVVPELPGMDRLDSVVALDDLAARLVELERWRRKGSTETPPVESSRPIMFCAMPFDVEYDDTFRVAMAGAADSCGLTARRVDEDEFAEDIVEYIKHLIQESVIVVADVSDAKANVMYEAGYAHGIGKTVVAVCSTPLDDLPFDISHNNTIQYAKGQTTKLRERLTKRVGALV